MSRRLPLTLALCAWTLLVWTTRVGNIWGDDDLTTGEKWGRTGLALSFTVLAVAALVAVLRRDLLVHPRVDLVEHAEVVRRAHQVLAAPAQLGHGLRPRRTGRRRAGG